MFVDIHHHLIYGVDDGAQTWEDTQKMILRAVDEGITNGTTATTFSPYQNCTRAQIVTFLYRTR